MVVLIQPILGLKAPLYCTVKMYGGLLRDVIPRNNKVLSLQTRATVIANAVKQSMRLNPKPRLPRYARSDGVRMWYSLL